MAEADALAAPDVAVTLAEPEAEAVPEAAPEDAPGAQVALWGRLVTPCGWQMLLANLMTAVRC